VRLASLLKAAKYRTVDGGASFFSDHLVVQIPYVLVGNANRRQHWTAVSSQRKKLRKAVGTWFSGAWAARKEVRSWPGWEVTVTRIAPRKVDGHDNLRTICKGVIDEVTAWIGLKTDSDERIKFEYEQERDHPHTYGILVEIRKRVP
jgi:hypothetical protein